MAGALTLFFLLAVSLTIVRAAGVALRLTGVPQSIARFQAISALTGAGYTTTESETLMRHPVRRRILMILMLTGHLGLVSLASTVILAVAATEGPKGAAVQIIALLLSVAAIYALASSQMLDRIMCIGIGRLMDRLNLLAPELMAPLYVDRGGEELVEHVVASDLVLDASTIPVQILAGCEAAPGADKSVSLRKGEILLCYGHRDNQFTFSKFLQSSSKSE